MRVTIRTLAVLLLAVVMRAHAATIPDALHDWQDWVLHGQEFRTCPWLATHGPNNESSYRCAWPGALTLDLTATGGRFEQRWELNTETWLILPGSVEDWPRDVRVDGNAAPVVLRAARPQLRLKPGTHEVTGRFAWATRPEALSIAPATAMVRLTLDGKLVAQPVRGMGGRGLPAAGR